MKTMINKIIVVLMAAAFALPAVAQWSIAQEPSTQFQSTSTLTGSGSSYSTNPTLNADGTASYNDATQPANSPRPHKAPPIHGDDDNDMPVGDATLPLLLFAAAFAATVAIRNRRRQVAE